MVQGYLGVIIVAVSALALGIAIGALLMYVGMRRRR